VFLPVVVLGIVRCVTTNLDNGRGEANEATDRVVVAEEVVVATTKARTNKALVVALLIRRSIYPTTSHQ
jgi:hypothetical protein